MSSRGAVQVTLVSVASDGTRYRLPAGSSVGLVSGSFGLSQVLDGAAQVMSISVPPGSYTATLTQPDGTTGANWMLERIDAGGNSLGFVSATLLTANPASLTVTTNQSTPLVFSFRIPTGGTITFDRGTIDVSFSAAEQNATSFDFSSDSALTVAATTFTGPHATELAARLPAAGATGIDLVVGGDLTGPWIEVGGTAEGSTYDVLACAPPTITAKTLTGSTGLQDFVAETGFGADPTSLFGPASLCIEDNGTQNFIRIRVSRTGAATTATFTDIDPGSLNYRLVLLAALPHRAYDSAARTLDLGQLMADSGPLTLTTATARIFTIVDNTFADSWYSSRFTGTMSFTFAGH